MDKEFKELSDKLEKMFLLLDTGNYEEQHEAIELFKRDQKMHQERLGEMLACLPLNIYAIPECFNQDDTIAMDDDQPSNQNKVLINISTCIDISDFLMNIKPLLMKRIDYIISVSIQLIFFAIL